MFELQNYKLTYLAQVLQEVTANHAGDQSHSPSHLSDELQYLKDFYAHICQLQKSQIKFLETLWYYLEAVADISQYLDEIKLLLSELVSNSQSLDRFQHLQALLHELTPKQERLHVLKEMRAWLQQFGKGVDPRPLEDMNLQFEELKMKQAALFEIKETEEVAEELISGVQQDIERVRQR